jgi:hypothetical protein
MDEFAYSPAFDGALVGAGSSGLEAAAQAFFRSRAYYGQNCWPVRPKRDSGHQWLQGFLESIADKL